MASIEILPFRVLSYNGSHGAQHPIEGIFSKTIHCSKPGGNFDLVLVADEPITLTHFFIRAPRRCTCPIKSGLVWISDTQPDLASYSHLYDNYTSQKFQQRDASAPHSPTLFFETPRETLEFQAELAAWSNARYVHIKFIDCHRFDPTSPPNIDILSLALLGFRGEGHEQRPLGRIPDSLDLATRLVTPNALNLVHPDFIRHFRAGPTLVLFDENPAARAVLSEFAARHAEAEHIVCFGAVDLADSESLSASLAQKQIGLTDPAVVIVDLETDSYYALRYDSPASLTVNSVLEFCRGVSTNSWPKYRKSKARPANDADPDHPGLTIVVGDSFEEIVLNPDTDVFLDVYADWCGPCAMIAPVIAEVARLLANHPSIVIAKIDSDHNYTDRKYLPETTVPNLKLFPRKHKRRPIPFEKDWTAVELLKFLHEHATEKFELAPLLQEAAAFDHLRAMQQRVNAILEGTKQDLSGWKELAVTRMPPDAVQVVEEAVSRYLAIPSLNLEQCEEVEELVDSPAFTLFRDTVKILEQEAELRYFGSFLRPQNMSEFKSMTSDTHNAPELSLFYFCTSWSRHCKHIAPAFSALAQQHTDTIQFVKIDVDLLPRVASTFRVRRVPTFMMLKQGRPVAAVDAPVIEAIEELITAVLSDPTL